MSKLKRISIIVIATAVISVVACWLYSYISAEMLTKKHYSEFALGYQFSGMIDEIDTFKVLSYSKDFAKVYYISAERSSGNLFIFVKQNNEWTMKSWETIWSKSGSADDFIWPYIR